MNGDGGTRILRGAAAAVAVTVLAAGCSSEGASEPRAEASATAAPSPSPANEPSPKVLAARAFRRLQIAYKREDSNSTIRMFAPATIKALDRLQRVVATGGPDEIARLTPWQKIVLTILRTDVHHDLLEGASPELFFGYGVYSYELDYFPSARLDPDNVKITGPRTAVAVIGGSPVWFQLVDGEWKVDARGIFELGSFVARRMAKRQGRSVDEIVLAIAEVRSDNDLPPDVWEKP
ncbi:MAG TPA: hypothetical protein VEU29_07270 [Actinomycetota bacterium]|nr:hypothetical protein [Actinomycetota bacterium]